MMGDGCRCCGGWRGRFEFSLRVAFADITLANQFYSHHYQVWRKLHSVYVLTKLVWYVKFGLVWVDVGAIGSQWHGMLHIFSRIHRIAIVTTINHYCRLSICDWEGCVEEYQRNGGNYNSALLLL